MKVSRESMLLYAVTDRSWLREKSLADEVEGVLKAGATFLQIREKDLPYEEFLREARILGEVAARYGVPYVVNDNIEVALAVDADGVHVGQTDMDAMDVRKMIGKDKILGVSAQTVEQAKRAESCGADYIGVGAIFTTSTKSDAKNIGFDTLRDICAAVSIPVVAIGGITEENILELSGTGADGVAVISAIFAKPDPAAAAARLLSLSKRMVTA